MEDEIYFYTRGGHKVIPTGQIRDGKTCKEIEILFKDGTQVYREEFDLFIEPQFQRYVSTIELEMRPVLQSEIDDYAIQEEIYLDDNRTTVIIAPWDKERGSPKLGDVIARDIKKPDEQWLIRKEMFEKHYVKPLKT